MKSGDRSNKISIAYDGERCLYARSIWAQCSSCTDSCPSGAISIKTPGRPPEVDSTLCMQCGQCLSACPVEAFESTSFSERQLLSRLEGRDLLRLHCFLPYDALSSLASSVKTYQLGTCLASLSPGALFELALMRPCELDTGRCGSCALFQGVQDTFRDNFRMASALLADWGAEHRLTDTTHVIDSQQEESGAYEGGTSCENADDSSDAAGFKSLQDGLHDDGDDEKSLGGVGVLPTRSFESRIHSLFANQKNRHQSVHPIQLRQRKPVQSAWRTRLRTLWTESDGDLKLGYPWPMMEVDGMACLACGMCMQMCPTGAITLLQSEDEFIHSMVPGECIDCRLCIVSCPAGALSRSYQPCEHPFSPMECASMNSVPCLRCGMPVVRSEGDYCRLCASGNDAVSLDERVRKQMQMVRNVRSKVGGC